MAVGVAAAGLLPMTLHAAPLLRCQIEQGGVSRVLEFSPVTDPYTVAATDINGRFRFKAVVVGDARHVDYVKLYVYEQKSRQPRLIQQATFLAPAVTSDPSPAALTGTSHVYASYLERELQYGCALIGTTS